jgi:hypothetical protein
MKLLFNLDVIEGKRVRARPSDYLKSLPVARQIEAVTEFLNRAGNELRNTADPKTRAEAEIGVATATEFLQKLDASAPRIYTGNSGSNDKDHE